MIEWLYELLGSWLGKGDGKRRNDLCRQRSRALSVFDDTKKRLQKAKDNLDGEKQKCDARVTKKKVELEDEMSAADEMVNEQKKIDSTVETINKILGVEDIESVTLSEKTIFEEDNAS